MWGLLSSWKLIGLDCRSLQTKPDILHQSPNTQQYFQLALKVSKAVSSSHVNLNEMFSLQYADRNSLHFQWSEKPARVKPLDDDRKAIFQLRHYFVANYAHFLKKRELTLPSLFIYSKTVLGHCFGKDQKTLRYTSLHYISYPKPKTMLLIQMYNFDGLNLMTL